MMNYDYIKQGDCLELMKEIPDKSIDMILCDLPYGVTALKWDKTIDINKLWAQYKRIIKDNGAIVLFGNEPFSSLVRCSNLEMYRYDWIWKKHKPSNFQLMNYQCGRITENIMVFSKGKACYTSNGNNMIYNPQKTVRNKIRKANAKIYGNTDENILNDYKTKDNFKKYSFKQPTNILEFKPVYKNRLMPTQKPVELCEYLIKTYTNKDGIVLDNCMGSGTTCVACINTNRHYIGFEIDEKHYNTAKERIEKAIGNR